MSKQIKIVHVSDDNCDVSLNVGSINGVQEGDKFLVYSLSDHEIVDPDTGESLGYLEFVKGTGEVVHVQDKMCTITSVTYRKPKKLFRMITGSRYLLTILMWEILQNLFKYSFQKRQSSRKPYPLLLLFSVSLFRQSNRYSSIVNTLVRVSLFLLI